MPPGMGRCAFSKDRTSKGSVPHSRRYGSLFAFVFVGIVLGTILIGGMVSFHPSVSLPVQILYMALVGGPVGGLGGLAIWVVYRLTQR